MATMMMDQGPIVDLSFGAEDYYSNQLGFQYEPIFSFSSPTHYSDSNNLYQQQQQQQMQSVVSNDSSKTQPNIAQTEQQQQPIKRKKHGGRRKASDPPLPKKQTTTPINKKQSKEASSGQKKPGRPSIPSKKIKHDSEGDSETKATTLPVDAPHSDENQSNKLSIVNKDGTSANLSKTGSTTILSTPENGDAVLSFDIRSGLFKSVTKKDVIKAAFIRAKEPSKKAKKTAKELEDLENYIIPQMFGGTASSIDFSKKRKRSDVYLSDDDEEDDGYLNKQKKTNGKKTKKLKPLENIPSSAYEALSGPPPITEEEAGKILDNNPEPVMDPTNANYTQFAKKLGTLAKNTHEVNGIIGNQNVFLIAETQAADCYKVCTPVLPKNASEEQQCFDSAVAFFQDLFCNKHKQLKDSEKYRQAIITAAEITSKLASTQTSVVYEDSENPFFKQKDRAQHCSRNPPDKGTIKSCYIDTIRSERKLLAATSTTTNNPVSNTTTSNNTVGEIKTISETVQFSSSDFNGMANITTKTAKTKRSKNSNLSSSSSSSSSNTQGENSTSSRSRFNLVSLLSSAEAQELRENALNYVNREQSQAHLINDDSPFIPIPSTKNQQQQQKQNENIIPYYNTGNQQSSMKIDKNNQQQQSLTSLELVSPSSSMESITSYTNNGGNQHQQQNHNLGFGNGTNTLSHLSNQDKKDVVNLIRSQSSNKFSDIKVEVNVDFIKRRTIIVSSSLNNRTLATNTEERADSYSTTIQPLQKL